MIIEQDKETGFWNVGLISTHPPTQCEGELCDVHNRRGTGPQATWPLNYRGDRGVMEVICPCGVGHPSPAQIQFWEAYLPYEISWAEKVHGCCGCCSGYELYDLSRDVHNVAQAISGRETYTSEHYNQAYELVSEIVTRALREGEK